MAKDSITIQSTERIAHCFRAVVNKHLRNYYVLVENDVEENGTWHCLVHSRDFLGYGRVEVMDLLYAERIQRSSKAASVNVAREALRHYLYKCLDDNLPF